MRQLSKYLLCLNIQLLLSGTWHLISMGYKFHFAPSLGQIWFCVNFTFFFWILSQSLNHCMIYGDRDTAKEQWRSGLWDKSRSPLSAVLWVDSSEVTHGCSRSSDLEYVGKWGNFFTPLIVYLDWLIFYHLQSLFRNSSALPKSDFGSHGQRTGSLRMVERTSTVNRGLNHDFQIVKPGWEASTLKVELLVLPQLHGKPAPLAKIAKFLQVSYFLCIIMHHWYQHTSLNSSFPSSSK